MFAKKEILLLIAILLSALILRFLYFPQNIYFGFDQARDAFSALDILKGDIKLIGPPTTFEGLNHGVLYYYLYAPFYFFGKGSPEVVAGLLRIINSLGIFLIFAIASILFNKYVGLIAALLYAFSFEQTQFALYFNHPSFAVISILILFLGLSILIFKKKEFGLPIAVLGLGLSIQFEFLLTYLIVPFLLILFIFRKSLPKLQKRSVMLTLLVFGLTLSTFMVAEVKYGFNSLKGLSRLLFSGSEKSLANILSLYIFEMGQVIKFNISGFAQLKNLASVILITSFLLALKSKLKKQVIFLGIWFFSVFVIYIVNGGGDIKNEVIQYHPNVGISLSLIIFTSFLIFKTWKKNLYLAVVILILILTANLSLIQKINPFGSMPEINAQSFMLLSDQKKVLDYIYQDAKGKPFAVKAITLPFYINTTWSYLFEWYGLKNYGYLPVWNGINAKGYAGNLIVEDSQDKSPDLRYLIIEPVRGIPTYLIDDYLREESYFSDLKNQTEVGQIKLQIRHKK